MNFKSLIMLILFSFSYLCGQSLICEEGEIDLGWGFPSFKGGILQFVNDYGIKEFLCCTKELSDEFGDR